jgi:poly-gamma-glutamate synthesis protein (capsule biosynthesis protein)
MMLARGVEATIQRNGVAFLFDGMRRLYKGSDLVTTNAEGVFSDVSEAQKPVEPDDLRFPFEPAWLATLARTGFTHLGLANNHSNNFGREALVVARGLIQAAGMNTFGDPSNQSEIMNVTSVRGRRVAQIGFHQFAGQGADDVVKAIGTAKKGGAFVVVYPHWGVEYERRPTRTQMELAHRFIDAGADVIIGAHPHVLQTVEVYNGKAIFYSLGNFIFDQSFSAATSEGLAVGIADDGKETVFHLMPFDIRNGQPRLMSYEKRRMLLRTLAQDSNVSDDVKASIESGIFTLKLPL